MDPKNYWFVWKLISLTMELWKVNNFCIVRWCLNFQAISLEIIFLFLIFLADPLIPKEFLIQNIANVENQQIWELVTNIRAQVRTMFKRKKISRILFYFFVNFNSTTFSSSLIYLFFLFKFFFKNGPNGANGHHVPKLVDLENRPELQLLLGLK